MYDKNVSCFELEEDLCWKKLNYSGAKSHALREWLAHFDVLKRPVSRVRKNPHSFQSLIALILTQSYTFFLTFNAIAWYKTKY
jgi:hypothetical protein